jgi:D-glycero-alpha-D-manno-heptose-7-phosphate kinase
MIIRARAPLRLGLAGGGTDVAPYCDDFGGFVLNAAIDRYAYAIIKPNNSNEVYFCAADKKSEVHHSIPFGSSDLSGDLSLHKAVYREIMLNHNGGKFLPLSLTTFCDAPIGSGLGASSTLVVAMIKAFAELLNLALDDYAIAQLAYKIERHDCGLQGGRQDQYSAAFGGFNFMEFYANDRAVVNSLRIKNWVICELEASLILFYTGVSRQSATIIAEQSDNIAMGSISALDAMHGLKNEALVMKECLLRGDFQGVVSSMQIGWENKKKSAKAVSNPLIDEIYVKAIEAGAVAGKVSGAGGGGFMMFIVPPERRMDVIHELNNYDGQVSNCHFTKSGAQAWRL